MVRPRDQNSKKDLRDTSCWVYPPESALDAWSAIKSSLMDRLLLAESSLERAHNTISDLNSDLNGIKTELAEVRAEKRKSDIISELRAKEFNLLFHGLPTVGSDETPEQSEDVVRSFLTTSLRFPESDLAKISFANVNRLPKRISALQSSSTSSSHPPAIVVKFVKMKDRNMISKLAARARQFKKNITKHLPRSMQEQRKSLLRKASKLFASGKKIRWKIEGAEYCLYANGEKILPD